ncbi:MAG: DUF1338 domain-containing protein [Kangiellaceae bacterium]
MTANIQKLETFFQSMWFDYLALNPQADQIFKLFSHNDTVINDHIALRTFGLPGIQVEDIAKPLIKLGYTEQQSYHFEQKRLRAKHYSHPSMPLIFISELVVESFSSKFQTLVKQIVNQIDLNRVQENDFLYSGRHWQVSTGVYNQLLRESEYAAWVAAFGYRANHFTVSINDLTHFNGIDEVNHFIKQNGFTLNASGGEIKGNKDSLLEQSSTMANRITVDFSDAQLQIPSCFYEFAYRYPMANGELFRGFVASSADKIFESTNDLDISVKETKTRRPRAA